MVRPWGEEKLVGIAANADEAVAALARALEVPPAEWLERVDRRLSLMSWDRTWAGMRSLIRHAQVRVVQAKRGRG